MPGKSLIGNLAVNLTLETAAFQRGTTIAEKRTEAMRSKFAAASKSVSGFGAALGVGIGVAAISNVARSAFDMASALEESAEKVGLSVEALQELRFAAQQTGVSEDQLSAALNRLNKSMGELQLGKKGAVDAFAQIGLAAADLKGKAPEEALRIIADALNKLPDVQQRVAVGSQIMGRGFSALLPLINGGSKALDSYGEAARKNGIITAEEAKQLDQLADSWDRMKTKALVAVAKVIAALSQVDQAIFKWYEFRDKALTAIGELATGAVNSINKMVSGISAAITGRLNAVWEGAKSKIQSVINAFKTMWDKVVGHSYVPDMVDEIGAQMARLDAVLVQPVIDATSKTAEAFRALQEQTRGLLDRLFPEASELNQLREEMKLLEDAMKSGILTAEQYAAALDRLQREKLSDDPLDVTNTGALVPANDDFADSLPGNIEAATSTMQRLADISAAANEAMNRVVDDGIANLAEGLTNVISGTAKLGDVFKSVAAQILHDLLRIQIQKMLISALTSITGGVPIFGGARAAGGPVARGKAYLVGENGPELFSPGTSGRVIANDDMRWGHNRGNTILNFNGVRDFDTFRHNERQMGRAARRAIGINQ